MKKRIQKPWNIAKYKKSITDSMDMNLSQLWVIVAPAAAAWSHKAPAGPSHWPPG